MAERYFGSDEPSNAATESGGATKVEEVDGAEPVIVITPEQVTKASELSPPFRVPPFFASRSTASPEADEKVQAMMAEPPLMAEPAAKAEPPAVADPPADAGQPAEAEQAAEPEDTDDV